MRGEVEDGQGRQGIIIVDPTHKDGDALTEKLREVRKAAGLVSGEERTFTRLTGLNWTPAAAGRRRALCRAMRSSSSSATRPVQGRAAGHGGGAAAACWAEVKPGAFRACSRPGEVTLAVGDTSASPITAAT